MFVLPKPTALHGDSSQLQRVLLQTVLSTLLSLACFLAPPGMGNPIIADPQCPQFCYCSETFVTCTEFTLLDLSMIPQSTETLVLTNGEVHEITPAFLRTAPNLKVLEIRSVNTRILRSHAFMGLKGLKMLSITDSTFDIVEPDSFSKISEIETFEIMNSKFGRVGKHAFGHITNIMDFNIWSNTFAELTGEAFVGLKNVDTLHLVRNNISQLGRDIFKDARGIGTVVVYQNKIGKVEPGSMEKLAQIANKMKFKDNTFRCTCELAWILDQPALKEYMGINQCYFTQGGKKANPDNTFKLSETNIDALCSGQGEEIETSPEDTQSLQYSYVPYIDEHITIVGETGKKQDQEKTTDGDGKLVKPENPVTSATSTTEETREESTPTKGVVTKGNDIEQGGGKDQTSDPSTSSAMTPTKKEFLLMTDNVATLGESTGGVDSSNTRHTDIEVKFTEGAHVLDNTEEIPEISWSEEILHPFPARDVTQRRITFTTKQATNENHGTGKTESSFEHFTEKTNTATTVASIPSSSSKAEDDDQSETIAPILETFDLDISEINSFDPDLSQFEPSQATEEIFELPSTRTADAAKPAVNDMVTLPKEWFTEAHRGPGDRESRGGNQPTEAQDWDLGHHMKAERLNSDVERDSASTPVPVCFILILSLVTFLLARS